MTKAESASGGTHDIDAPLDAVVSSMGGTRREGQHEMARAVADTLDEEASLLVQAGTGTGKSFAYLVPALLHSVSHGTRAVISTATLALQRQILGHDLPMVSAQLEPFMDREADVALLKGWHNYVCKHKIAGGYPEDDSDTLFEVPAATNQAEEHPSTESESLGEQVVRARAWAEETETGDRDELVPGVSERAWRQVSVTSLECLGQRCPLLSECFPERARAHAREADVVVTNHAMLGVAAAGSAKVLPEHDVLIVDEAHELADRVTAASTVELSAASIERAARTVRKHAGIPMSSLEEAAGEIRPLLMGVAEGRIRGGLPEELLPLIRTIADGTREAMTAMREQTSATNSAGAKSLAHSAMLELFEVCDRLLSDRIATNADVLWCERGHRPGEGSKLKLAPLNVSGTISRELFCDKAVVLTSATLALGGKFDSVAAMLGLQPGEYRSEIVASPFDYPRQGILYVAADLQSPGREGTDEKMLDYMRSLIEAAGGGALGLFSSRRGAEAAAEALREKVDVPILLQGEDTIPTLVREFAADPKACLFGTLSLWQGVDVPGLSCRLVMIDRIPFPRPDDPIKAARTEAVGRRGGNGFMAVAASHAALLLAQGAGRLIRTTDDRGVVAVLDPRLATARYGSFLSASLPPLWRTTDRNVVTGALERLAKAAEPTTNAKR